MEEKTESRPPSQVESSRIIGVLVCVIIDKVAVESEILDLTILITFVSVRQFIFDDTQTLYGLHFPVPSAATYKR